MLQRPRPRRRLAGTALRWVLPQFAAAAGIGIVWWLLAPGGRVGTSEDYIAVAEAPAATDAWFAVLCAGAGAVTAMVWVATRHDPPDRRSVVALVSVLLGGLLAASLAVFVGAVLDGSTSPPATDAGVDRIRLDSVAGAVLWPLAAAVVVLADTGRDLLAGALAAQYRHIRARRTRT